VGDEVLEGLIVAQIPESPVHGLYRLPLAVAEQPVDVLRRRLTLRLAAEARAELIEELAQSSQQRPCRARRHARSVLNAAHPYKRNPLGGARK